jgi:hypothetical protein
MNKYMVIIAFPTPLGQDFFAKIPAHRTHINRLIQNDIIESYAVSAERAGGWIIMNARTKEQIHEYLRPSPLYAYFEIDIDELMVYDSRLYRFPKLMLN